MPWVELRFRHLGVLFYGLNTAQPANATTFPGRRVESSALARMAEVLGKALRAESNDPPVVIGKADV